MDPQVYTGVWVGGWGRRERNTNTHKDTHSNLNDTYNLSSSSVTSRATPASLACPNAFIVRPLKRYQGRHSLGPLNSAEPHTSREHSRHSPAPPSTPWPLCSYLRGLCHSGVLRERERDRETRQTEAIGVSSEIMVAVKVNEVTVR